MQTIDLYPRDEGSEFFKRLVNERNNVPDIKIETHGGLVVASYTSSCEPNFDSLYSSMHLELPEFLRLKNLILLRQQLANQL